MQGIVPNTALTERDDGFLAALRVVRGLGSYPRERAGAVFAEGLLLGGVLFGGVVLTAILAKFVSAAVGGLVFLATALIIAFVVIPRTERRLFRMRAAFAYLVTRRLVSGEAAPASDASAAAERFLAERFGDVGPIVDAHDEVVRMTRSFFRTFDRLDDLLPIDLGFVRTVLGYLVDRVAPYVADLALSFAIVRGDRDYATAAKDAVVYVAQNPKALLGAGVRADLTVRFLGGVVGAVFFVLGFVAASLAVGALARAAAGDLPAEGATTVSIFAGVFAGFLLGAPLAMLASWFVRTTWLEPAGLTMLIIRFHTTIRGQALDPSIRARLDRANGDLGQARGLMNLLD